MTRPDAPRRAAVLISGGGTNLQALIDASADGTLDVSIDLVVSNRGDAYGLTRANQAGIPTAVIDHRQFADRRAFDETLAETVAACSPDVVVLAGFMRILSGAFVEPFLGRLLNIHPSLLPKYPGLDTHQRALDAGDRWHGSTVHFVTEELDGGPRIVQGRVGIEPDDDAKSLAARVLSVEHQIYPYAVELLVSGRLAWRDGGAWLDGEPLTEPVSYPP